MWIFIVSLIAFQNESNIFKQSAASCIYFENAGSENLLKKFQKPLDKSTMMRYNLYCCWKSTRYASVLELADRHVWGACVSRRTGSSPVTRTSNQGCTEKVQPFFVYSGQGKSAVGISYKMRISVDSVCGGLWLFSIQIWSAREKYHNHYFGNWSKVGTRQLTLSIENDRIIYRFILFSPVCRFFVKLLFFVGNHSF